MGLVHVKLNALIFKARLDLLTERVDIARTRFKTGLLVTGVPPGKKLNSSCVC